MSVYKRGDVYWYTLVYRGKRYQRSTKQHNRETAKSIEGAFRSKLASGEAGITVPKLIPTFSEFAPRFIAKMRVHCQDKPRTLEFWQSKLAHLLTYRLLAGAQLDQIKPELIDRYASARFANKRTPSIAQVNRELATLRRIMRLAQEWEIIATVPRIRMFRGEGRRDFILNHQQEGIYLAAAPQPLQDFALLLVDTGLRVGEVCALTWVDVHLEPLEGCRYGYLTVRKGKSENARRNVSLTARVREMLLNRSLESASTYVFANSQGKPYQGTRLCQIHALVRATLGLPAVFVLHSLRHTALTRLGESGCDAFTIKRVAGHSSITVSERYVHPTPEGMERAFERLEAFNNTATNGNYEQLSNRLVTVVTGVTSNSGNAGNSGNGKTG